MTEQKWMPGDVYFGDAEKPLPDWRKEEQPTDAHDDEEPSEEDRQAVIAMLGFDPQELNKKDGSSEATMNHPSVKPSPFRDRS